MSTAEQHTAQESLDEEGRDIGDVHAGFPQSIVPADFVQAGVVLGQCVIQGFRHRLGVEPYLYDLDESGLGADHPVRRQLYDFQSQESAEGHTPSVASSPVKSTGEYSACGYADTDFIAIERAYEVGLRVKAMARIIYDDAGDVFKPVLIQKKHRGEFTALVVGGFAIDGVQIQPGSLVNISSNAADFRDRDSSSSRTMPIDEITDAAYLRPTLYMSQENDWPERLERMKRLAGALLRADLV